MRLWTTRRKPVDDGRKHTLTCYDGECRTTSSAPALRQQNEGLTTGTSPSYGQGGKPNGC